MKISICIPTWEQYGRGVEFLKNNFEILLSQTYKNFNVIISDHSKDDNIKLLCDEYSNHFEIKYFKNEENSTTAFNLDFYSNQCTSCNQRT